MSSRGNIGVQLRFSELPKWRRSIALICLGVCLFLGWMATSNEISIYASSPTTPVSATGQVHEMLVMHGSLRYVTIEQQENLRFWNDKMLSLAGIPFVVAFLALVRFRRE